MMMGNMEQVRESFKIGQIIDYSPPSAPVAVPMPRCWYIRRVAPNHEFKIMKRCGQLGLSAYLPTITSMREFHRRRAGYEWIERKNSIRPLITGAILVPDFEVHSAAWKAVDGVFGILRFGEFIPTLTPKLMADIRKIEDIANTPKSKRNHYFEIGRLIRVVSGPFKHFCGRVERLDTGGRIGVGIEIFLRITLVVFDESEIEAV